MMKKCLVCKVEFSKSVNCSLKEWKDRKFCSHSCGYKYRDKGKRKSVCRTCLKEFIGSYALIPKYCSQKCAYKRDGYWSGKKRPNISGKNNNNWKGGISTEQDKKRKTYEYRKWKKEILLKYNFTCQKTGISGGELHAHHINNFSDFPELRYDIDNGILLSKQAHTEFHKMYGLRNNTREQLMEFLNLTK